MSEVHKHEQAAVSPSFILNLTKTTQELGTSFPSSFVCCVSLFLCVASGEKRRSPTFAPGSCGNIPFGFVVESSLLTRLFVRVCFSRVVPRV